MAVRQQQRRGTAAQWTSANPILSAAEIGYETDTNKFKIGDGTNRWSTLSYFVDLDTMIAGAPGLLNSLDEIAAAINDDPAFFTTIASSLSSKAPIASPTFTGTVSGVTKSMVGLDSVDNTADTAKPVSTAQATAIATAKSEAISTAAADATTKVAAEAALRATAVTAAIATASADATSKVAAEATARNSAINTAIADVVGAAPAALDTLKELADALTADQSTASTLATLVGTKAPIASPTFTGTVVLPVVTASGDIIPATDNTYSLGSPSKMFKDVYVGPGSLYVNGQKVLQDESGAIVVSADINENLGLRTSGSGNIELDPTGTGSINVKGPVVVEAGANFSSADGNGVTFSNGLKSDTVSSKTSNTDLSLSGNGTGKVYLNDNAEVNGNLTVVGNLNVGGTVTTINSETISLADNIIDLNSNFTSGNPTENSGIRVVRGDETNVQVRWNESLDKWQFTNDGSVFSDIAPAQSPTFTGTPAAPTAATGTDTTQVATTAFVKAAIQNISSLDLVLDGGGV